MIYDVCQLIMCKTAPRENWINHFILSGTEATDLQYIEDILKNFSDPSPKMALLGFCNKKKGSFIQKLFEIYVNNNYNVWNLIGFIDYICDDKLLKKQLSAFYFSDFEDSQPLSKIFSSSYPDNIKTLLYEFFLFTPEFVIEIKEELTKYILNYERYYEQNLSRILDFQESFDYSNFSSSTSSRQIKLNKQVNTYCISISLLSQYTIIGNDNNKFGWLVLGTGYMKVLPNNEVAIDVSGFGNAFQGRKVLYCLNINQIKKSNAVLEFQITSNVRLNNLSRMTV